MKRTLTVNNRWLCCLLSQAFFTPSICIYILKVMIQPTGPFLDMLSHVKINQKSKSSLHRLKVQNILDIMMFACCLGAKSIFDELRLYSFLNWKLVKMPAIELYCISIGLIVNCLFISRNSFVPYYRDTVKPSDT